MHSFLLLLLFLIYSHTRSKEGLGDGLTLCSGGFHSKTRQRFGTETCHQKTDSVTAGVKQPAAPIKRFAVTSFVAGRSRDCAVRTFESLVDG